MTAANLPAVIHPRLGPKIRKRIRALLRERHGDHCCWCGGEMEFHAPSFTVLTATIEHIIPRRIGGGHDPAFLRLAHYKCNIWFNQGRPFAKRRRSTFRTEEITK